MAVFSRSAWEKDVMGIIVINTPTIVTGFGGSRNPRDEFPCVYGKPKDEYLKAIPLLEQKAYYVGDEAVMKRLDLDLSYPMKSGRIVNSSEMEAVWNYTFSNALHISPEEHPVFMTVTPFTTKQVHVGGGTLNTNHV